MEKFRTNIHPNHEIDQKFSENFKGIKLTREFLDASISYRVARVCTGIHINLAIKPFCVVVIEIRHISWMPLS